MSGVSNSSLRFNTLNSSFQTWKISTMASPGIQMLNSYCLKVGTGPAGGSAIVEIQHLLPESMLWSAWNIYTVSLFRYVSTLHGGSVTPPHHYTKSLSVHLMQLNKSWTDLLWTSILPTNPFYGTGQLIYASEGGISKNKWGLHAKWGTRRTHNYTRHWSATTGTSAAITWGF